MVAREVNLIVVQDELVFQQMFERLLHKGVMPTPGEYHCCHGAFVVPKKWRVRGPATCCCSRGVSQVLSQHQGGIQKMARGEYWCREGCLEKAEVL